MSCLSEPNGNKISKWRKSGGILRCLNEPKRSYQWEIKIFLFISAKSCEIILMKNLVRSGIKAAYNPIQPNISVWSKNNPHLLRGRKFKVLPGILKETVKPGRKKIDQIVRYEVYQLQWVSLRKQFIIHDLSCNGICHWWTSHCQKHKCVEIVSIR